MTLSDSGITLVIGAGGFIGGHLVELLADQGVKVRATSLPQDDTSFFDRLGVEFVASDLTHPDSLHRLFDGPVDRVFHLGAICNFSTPFKALYPVNVAGVEHITNLALKKKVRSFVHLTSTSVYGYGSGGLMSESDAPDPMDSYAKSKCAGEEIVFSRIAQGLPAILVRPCTVYGPRCTDGAGKVFSRPSSIAAIPGDGKQCLSNIRVEDVAAALLFLSL